ncbi:hypothetical protein NTE_03473 [Candidatus Nitrososphaera evergladensis SR1]|uniref:Uncharacterized protein n=1 Tax=Candidatus Nitrososphaera evergladensis SR1 TaxID=1459636 RepID=A0A075MV18_9ARCH|nr:hypothetical protein NTE_03473 [Candidatus Nitrososphaera evergladensis SR1]
MYYFCTSQNFLIRSDIDVKIMLYSVMEYLHYRLSKMLIRRFYNKFSG